MLLRNRPVLKLGAGGTSYSFYSATKNRVRDRDNLREEEEGDELETEEVGRGEVTNEDTHSVAYLDFNEVLKMEKKEYFMMTNPKEDP